MYKLFSAVLTYYKYNVSLYCTIALILKCGFTQAMLNISCLFLIIAIVAEYLDTFSVINDIAEPQLPVLYPRTAGHPPRREENKYNAWCASVLYSVFITLSVDMATIFQ